MPQLTDEQVRQLLDRFFQGEPENDERRAIGRDSSFDYCFNHFRSFHEQGNLPALLKPPHLQEACLHLAAYLASWGITGENPCCCNAVPDSTFHWSKSS